jgi:hypothetical protein
VLRALSARCPGRSVGGGVCGNGQPHAIASGRAAREAAVYPFKLCKAILIGFRNQMVRDGRLPRGTHGFQAIFEEDAVGYFDALTGEVLDGDDVKLAVNAFTPSTGRTSAVYLDSVTGQPLESALVEKARELEMEYFNSKKVWAKRPYAEAMAKMGKKPISVRWIDTNKGDEDTPNYRSRLVAREIRKHGENPIFAPTPPLESLRTILSLAATDMAGQPKHVRDPDSEMRTQISFIDISRAYFCAATDPSDPTYVELPREDPDHGTKVGLLLKHMYGTRKAADGWHCEYAGKLRDLGFEVGEASACVFFHRARSLRCSVHGDDLTTVGSKTDLDWFKSELSKHYELKEPHRLGPGRGDDRMAMVLNRVVHWTEHGLQYEADPRQAEKMLRDLKLDGAEVKTAATPGVKATREQVDADEPLPGDKLSPYRAVVARGNYLSSDRPEVQFAAKETCRWMAHPTALSLNALKRLGRFVAGHKRLVFHYPWQVAARIDTYSDTDWAGCVKTRKSTSGGCTLLGRHLIKSWSSTQASVSLSSGESEFYGVVKAAGVSLGYQALLRDLGYSLSTRVWTDSTATMGICGRQGLGKLRHIDTQCLWIQQRVRDRSIELYKVRGEVNPADLFTKHLSSNERIQSLLAQFGCSYEVGRAAGAPLLRTGAGTSKGESLCSLSNPGGAGMLDWDGRQFPVSTLDGDVLPDAFMHHAGLLPHLHENFEDVFPKAKACEDAGDVDPLGEDGLEDFGTALGRAPEQKKNAVAISDEATFLRGKHYDSRPKKS